MRVKTDRSSCGQGADRDHVPGEVGSGAGDQEIDLIRGVNFLGPLMVRGADKVGAVAGAVGRPYLHAPQAAAGIQDEVVWFAIAVGLGYGEAEFGRLEKEGQFGDFALLFIGTAPRFPAAVFLGDGHEGVQAFLHRQQAQGVGLR